MNQQKQNGLNTLLESLTTLSNNAEKKYPNEHNKESLEKPLKETLDESVETEHAKIIDEQNKKIESLEKQLEEALNTNLVRLIQEYI